ncbi:hypothetical protein [Falsiroseomonas sp.]|uniref:hypothetical protein n=1 Tax=Falsiroseomonas sp. TaxID=2870721 RepID=UPI0035680F9E
MGGTATRTGPDPWEAVKRSVTRSGKGGRKGQWSVRKAQLPVQEYKRRGGRYAEEYRRTSEKKQRDSKAGRRRASRPPAGATA